MSPTNSESRHLFVPEEDSTLEPHWSGGNLHGSSESNISTDLSDMEPTPTEMVPGEMSRDGTTNGRNTENLDFDHTFKNDLLDSGNEIETDVNDFNASQENDMIIIPTQDPSSLNTITQHQDIPTIDLDAEEQQVVEILDDEEDDFELKKSKKSPESYKPVREYKCPICFESPDMAMITECGHVFCLDCLFQMVNNSNPNRNSDNSNIGLCALCRSKVDLKKITLLKMKKKIIS
ncbi:E3 ubiquitin-protein ligase complex SLX5-Slx8p subunit Slx8p [Monosporozyma servazzii]